MEQERKKTTTPPSTAAAEAMSAHTMKSEKK